MKNIIAIIISIALIVGMGLAEHYYIDKIFGDFDVEIEDFMISLNEGTLTENDIIKSEENWEKIKEMLHLIIPHNDIKPFNESFSELKVSLRQGDYDNAEMELQVLHDLIKTIPQTYQFTIENIF